MKKTLCIVASAALVVGTFAGAKQAGAAACLWISAPTWSYSAAYADSPIGAAYYWGLSVGVNTYSFAYAFSNDSPIGAAYAFADASAGGLGGGGAVYAAGFADPNAGLFINDPGFIPGDAGTTSDYPTSKPGSDPFTTPYTVSGTGITFSSGSEGTELNGADTLQAFTYNNSSSATYGSLESALGASGNGGTTSAGDVTSASTLASDLNLTPLDAPIQDPGNLSSLTFTENTSGLNTSDVILVATVNASSTPEPGALAFMALCGGALLLIPRRGLRR